MVILGPSGSGTVNSLWNNILRQKGRRRAYLIQEQRFITTHGCLRWRAFGHVEKIAFIFQRYLLPDLTVRQNVRWETRSGKQSWFCSHRELGLGDKLDREVSVNCRVGSSRKLSIARALASLEFVFNPDRPTGALDEETGRKILLYLETEGKAGLYLDHGDTRQILRGVYRPEPSFMSITMVRLPKLWPMISLRLPLRLDGRKPCFQ